MVVVETCCSASRDVSFFGEGLNWEFKKIGTAAWLYTCMRDYEGTSGHYWYACTYSSSRLRRKKWARLRHSAKIKFLGSNIKFLLINVATPKGCTQELAHCGIRNIRYVHEARIVSSDFGG